MKARTILLAKNPLPQSMHHGRPITILSILYRLMGKVIFSQVASQMAGFLPLPISGGLPGRGVKDIAIVQKFQIEQALMNGHQIGGFSLDLIKAFNNFGRFPLGRIMCRLGIPEDIVHFWLVSLSRMQRYLEHGGTISPPISSTTGVPEGDALSVIAMISLASAFYFRLKTSVVFPYAYADNWSWMTRSQQSHFRAFVKTLNLIESLRLSVDFQKSWHWGTTKDFREFCLHFALLFPSMDIPVNILTKVKDLGELVHYNKSVSLGFIQEKIQEAINRISRLEHLPIPYLQKLVKIQAAAWTVALYSADTTYVGPRHFQSLRRAVIRAVIGSKPNASPWIGCFATSCTMMDPFLHILCAVSRTIRRLAHFQPTIASDFVQMASQYEGHRPFGPATTFKTYFRLFGWDVCSNGDLVGPDYLKVNVLHDTPKQMKKMFQMAWPQYMIQNIDRKGVGEFAIHPSITAKAFVNTPDDDKILLCGQIVGAYQTEMQKSFWDQNCTGLCKLCGKTDSHEHRLLECDALLEVRQRLNEAIDILTNRRKEWCHIPIARQHPEILVQRAWLQHHAKYQQQLTYSCIVQDEMWFFTDGGCINPTDPESRVASWAVVQGTLDCQQQQDRWFRHQSNPLDNSTWTDGHFTLGMGIVPGEQTAARGEIFAIYMAVSEAIRCPSGTVVHFVTDSQYVCNIISWILQKQHSHCHYKMANTELIDFLSAHWDPRFFFIHKVKSHRCPSSAVDYLDLSFILGNSCADIAATTALQHLPKPMLDHATKIAQFNKNETDALTKVFTMMADNNRVRSKKIEQCPQTLSHNSQQQLANIAQDDALMPKNAMGVEAYDFLREFSPPYQVIFLPDISNESFSAIMQGATIADAVCQWIRLLKWPDGISPDYSAQDDWGISWFEMVINFSLITQRALPIRLSFRRSEALPTTKTCCL